MTFLKQIEGRWQGRGNASPRGFFQSAEPGVYFDFSAPAGLYQDSTGSAPLTTPDQWMKLAADKSRNRSPITVAAALQANTGLSPKWGSAPKLRRQRSGKSEPVVADLSNSTGVSNAVASIAGFSASIQFPSGAVGNRIAYRDHGSLADSQCTLSVFVQMDDGLPPVVGNASAALNDFTIVIANSSASGIYGPVVNIGGGIYRVSMSRLTSTTASGNTGLLKTDANSARGFRVTGFQLELGTSATAYQKATNPYEVTEVGFPRFGFIRPDLLDDVLTATLPAAQTGDVLVFGRNGSWVETGVTYASGSAWSIGINSVTGLPSGLLSAIGDIVGIVAIGRTLTAAERTMALEYHKARGAAGWLVAGAEQVVNGGFDTDTIWTKGTGWTIASGVASKASGTASALDQTMTFTDGLAYLVTFDAAISAGIVSANFVGGTAVGTENITTSGAKRYILVARSGNNTLRFSATSLLAGTIDNVSVKPLTVAA